tara:strand:- start:61733 stop:62671 length:939 start_codon:yes stop_codon:yes gene_type:complete
MADLSVTTTDGLDKVSVTSKFYPFDPNPRAPSVTLPPNTCDSQFHLLGSAEQYPVRPGALYEMPSATWDRLKHMHATLGISRGVVVQPTTYGADHSCTLDGLAALGPNYRGCANALVFVEKDDAYLEKLHAAGVRGARFSFRKVLGAVLDDKQFARAIDRIRELGWYVKIQPEQEGIMDNVRIYEDLDVPVVIDHMARANPLAGDEDPSLRKMVDLLGKGNFWVMLSLPEKVSRAGAPWGDLDAIVRTLVEAAPNRCIWASDWPHPISVRQPPNEADLVEWLFRAVPDAAARQKILVDNPAELFGFTDATVT